MAYRARHPTEIDTLEPSNGHDAQQSALEEAFVAPFPGDGSQREDSKAPSTATSERSPLLAKPKRHSDRRGSLEDGEIQEIKPASSAAAVASFFFASLLAFANLGFCFLTALSTVHSSVAAVLPAHRSSTFLPIWISGLSFLTAFLHMLYFASPKRSPVVSVRILNTISTACLLACLLLVTIVRELRYKEAILSIIVISTALATHFQTIFRPRILSHPPPPIVLPANTVKHDHEEPTSTSGKVGHFFKTLLSLLTITFPLFLIHLAIFVALLAITLNLGLRAYDSHLRAPGRLFWVNPTSSQTEGLVDRHGITGIGAYRIHLWCHGGSDYDGRTVLLHGPASRPGSTSAQWMEDVTEQLENSTIRVCRYDQPGYGFSDNAPTAALGHVAKALEEALDKAGEFARVSKPGGGFIVVGEGYGGLQTRVFAARNARHVRSMLFLDPQTELTYFEPEFATWSVKRRIVFFFRDVVGTSITPLGIRRFAALITDSHRRSKESRVLADARSGLSPGFGRTALQQIHEAHVESRSYDTLRKSLSNLPTQKPSILISSNDRLDHKRGWLEAHKTLVWEVLGRGVVRWDKVDGGHDVCESKEGRRACQVALADLLSAKVKH